MPKERKNTCQKIKPYECERDQRVNKNSFGVKITANARQIKKEADAYTKLAKKEAEAHAKQVKNEAKAHAKQVKNEAEAHAKQAKKEAEAHAKQVKNEAEAHAKQAKKEAEAKAKQLRKEAEAKVKLAKKEAVTKAIRTKKVSVNSIKVSKEWIRSDLTNTKAASSDDKCGHTFSPEEHRITCPICLDTEPRQPLMSLICAHTFHTDCVYKWLIFYENRCPLCRLIVEVPEEVRLLYLPKSKYYEPKY